MLSDIDFISGLHGGELVMIATAESIENATVEII